jgi:hypothetical protein
MTIAAAKRINAMPGATAIRIALTIAALSLKPAMKIARSNTGNASHGSPGIALTLAMPRNINAITIAEQFKTETKNIPV